MAFLSSLVSTSNTHFPGSYRHGQSLWQQQLSNLSIPFSQLNFSYPVSADDHSDLITQCAHLGNECARHTLVIIGGTHGVEGFAGTALQCDLMCLLSSGYIKLNSNTSILMINALNPWGYYYGHRHDHLGIDVNRNFIDFDEPLPDNPGYRQLQDILKLNDKQLRQERLRDMAVTMGSRDYEIAISGGQYADASGPFFGGTTKSHSHLVIDSLMSHYNLPERQLAVIDIHTGLGSYGYGEVICDHPLDSSGAETARDWYGPACTSAESGTSSSVPKQGLLDFAWHRIMHEDSCFITLEFGTLGTESLFNVLLEDVHPEKGRHTYGSESLLNHFCPVDDYWREAVIFRGRQVIFQALSGIRTPTQ